MVPPIFGNILLVIVLRRPKGRCGSYLGYNGSRRDPCHFEDLFGCHRKRSLFRIVREDHRAVLAPLFIRPLVIERCRVVELPKHVEDFLIGAPAANTGKFTVSKLDENFKQ
jgi:hypothetical protein